MRRRVAIAVWVAGLVVCALLIARAKFSADLSAFLPAAPTASQQVLVDQLRHGAISRLILIGIEGGNPPERARVSRAMGAQLRQDARFTMVGNGENVGMEREREILYANRYLLSDQVTPQRFSVEGLRGAISDTVDLIASPAGLLVKSLVPHDPTGELPHLLLDQLGGGADTARMADGVWVSRDGARALLIAHTRAAGSDTDAQGEAMRAIETAFAQASATEKGLGLKLRLTGPGVFSVESRNLIERDSTRLASASTLLIVLILLAIYRSPRVLMLGLAPVLSGALVAVSAVSLGFGTVHGLTLGFGTTLIGEAVDYSIYLFIQREGADADANWLKRFWPTVRLGVALSVCGFAALLFSNFPGLAQLGAYSVAGLVAAALVTRFVLPQLLPRDFAVRDLTPQGEAIARIVARLAVLRVPLVVLTLAALAFLIWRGDAVWNRQLAALNPVTEESKQLDASLRADLAAPDTRYLVLVDGADAEAALQAAEAAGAALNPLVEAGVIAGFESPARYLPSIATQTARRNALPAPEDLRARLAQATEGLPLSATKLEPFIADVAAARAAPLLTRESLAGSSFGLALDAMLPASAPGDARRHALLPLRAPSSGPNAFEIDPARVRAAIAKVPGASFIDLAAESNGLYAGYLHEALQLLAGGLAAVVLLLALALRSPLRVLRVLLPLAAAVVLVTAGFALAGVALTILHLVGLLLIVAVGSNYALFFDGAQTAHAPRMLASLVLANCTTVLGFGLLGFSSVNVLSNIGLTVGPGALLALWCSAIFAARRA